MGVALGVLLTLFGLFIIGFSRDSVRGDILLSYYFIWVFIIPFVVDFVFPLEIEIYFDIITWSSYFGILVFPLAIAYSNSSKEKIINRRFGLLLLAYLIIVIYGMFLGFMRGTLYQATKYAFMQFSPILMLINIFVFKPNKKYVINLLHRLLYLELFIGGLQLLGFFQYHMNSDASSFDFGRITGTFSGNNIYAEIVSLLMFFVIYIEAKKKGYVSFKGWVLVSIGFIVMVSSGIRTALIGYAICMSFILFTIYKNNKKGRRILLMFFALGILYFVINMWGGIMSGDMVYDSQTTGALERQGTLANILRDENYIAEHTTFYFTIYVLSFLPMNYLLGPGLLYTSSQGYGGVVNLLTNNQTDAAFAIYICEMGLIGVFLFLLLYFIILRKVNKSSVAYVFFVYLLLIYVTDLGPSFLPNAIFLYLIIYLESYEDNNCRFKKVLQPCV